jgi:2-dehydropantoate 2-reductase
MKIIILGAGAIGSFYGAKLSLYNEVILVGRPKHAEKINNEGLKITGLENKTYRLKASTKIENIEDGTLILLTTKVYDSVKAIEPIKEMLKKDTIILCLQNGLDSENIVKGIVGNKCAVLRGITNFGAAYLEPGIVGYNGKSFTAIEKSEKSSEIAKNFSDCGLNAYESKDIRYEMWKKLIVNCALNPVTSILRIKNNVLSEDNLNPMKKLITHECIAVAKKDGCNFDIDFVKEINDAFKNSTNTSSMQQDLIKGKHTEIDCLNGAVVKLGKKYGINCPVNEALVMIIKEMEKVKE